ncbi:DUF6268 family outer membrane beta-barrel protein [Sphingobacterium sp. E70]|nr:DUF6268 family outer membrane beta-barrel protein [Sphingobacterium sp. E70]ULT23741.1 DUF6268 family outer membrane beta-barrel protein [Sphingobacterium sp. E70]
MLNAEIGLQYLTSLKKNWSLLTFASVGIYSDLVKVNGKDVLGQGEFFLSNGLSRILPLDLVRY